MLSSIQGRSSYGSSTDDPSETKVEDENTETTPRFVINYSTFCDQLLMVS